MNKSFLNLIKTSFNTKSSFLFSHCPQTIFSNNFKPLYNLISCAQYRQVNYTKHPRGTRRRGGGWDENITPENKAFLNQVIIDNYSRSDSPLKDGPWVKGEWSTTSINKRTGLIAIKIGSYPQWLKDGTQIFTTLLQVLDNHVIEYLPPEVAAAKSEALKMLTKNGLYGIQYVGALSSDPRLFTPQYLERFADSGVPPKRKLTKFRITPNAALKPGTPLYAAHFRVGDYVDVGAYSMGYGFQGTMRKYGFKGGPKSHGATKFHRKRGTVGSGRKRKIVVKGTKMAGKMGGVWRKLRGLKIWRINNKYNILYVHGPMIPGPNHSYIRVNDTILPKRRKLITKDNHPPFPTYLIDEAKEPLEEEVFDEKLHQYKDPTLKFEDFQVKKAAKREGAKLAKIK